MQGYLSRFSVGKSLSPLLSQSTNQTRSAWDVRAASAPTVIDIDFDSIAFIVLSILCLYCYVGLVRNVPLREFHNPLSQTTGALLFHRRRIPKTSGLTIEDIDKNLTSFSVDEYTPSSSACSSTLSQSSCQTSAHCIVSFEQDSCAICLDEYRKEPPARLRRLKCDHLFHQGNYWLFSFW